jgi:N-acetylglutamate synthase-like GNAT family acetyltransferase
MDLRPYRLEDKAGCLAAFDSNVPDWFHATERDEYSAFLDQPAGPYFVMDHEGTIAGAAGYQMHSPDRAALRWLLVRRDLHHNGLGKLLVFSTLRHLGKNEDPTQIWLRTLPQTAPFFEKLGFHITATSPWVEMIKKLKVCP